MLDRKFSTRFKKDIKKYSHKREVIEEFNEVLKIAFYNRKVARKIQRSSSNRELFELQRMPH